MNPTDQVAYRAQMDDELLSFTRSVPPPPYSGNAQVANPAPIPVDASRADYDLTPMPQSVNRPKLPEEKRNAYLGELNEDSCIVKFQTIVRENREIVVGRIKVPTPNNSHAFILRRYDTDAISLTTMYKVAFPGASEEEERREMEWVRSSFDTRNMNGGRDCTAVRLAGQWVSRHLAIHIAPAYGLMELITALARAHPDPNVAYRKSQRSQIASDELKAPRPASAIPSLAAPVSEPAAKRARNASPARSASVASPARSASAAPPYSLEDERHITVEATTTITGPASSTAEMNAEIAQAKQMVIDLRRELQLRSASGQELEDQGVDMPADTRGRKRAAGEEDEVMISGGVSGRTERVIRANKKVDVVGGGGAAGRKIAWGAVMFGLGIGAASFIPQIASQFPAFASQFF
ncbi:uncharacterized protein MKK02DRAFT_31620 [Dioszegia hungarica]|uniref:HTH APSES-type domain-containing protein n=1 Tax=Dioszegia hungarica TaxID=4972 RepID=A0AA38LVM7_9TREE|nr:uncharacterized protein MKK02DRAFT_31620 [Dioszegia hungarica]KAI9638127.1 hypothetical protein MKK02DRAFT_31620 [Dioszegia hungarica]